MQYILKNADDENAVTMDDILNHLAKYGIEAERRSIYRDIHDLMELMNTEQEDGCRIKDRGDLCRGFRVEQGGDNCCQHADRNQTVDTW